MFHILGLKSHNFSTSLSKKRFIYLFERERAHASKSGVEGEGERILKQTRCWVKSWTWSSIPGPETMTWAEIKSRTLNWLSHPGAPSISLLKTTQHTSIQAYTKDKPDNEPSCHKRIPRVVDHLRNYLFETSHFPRWSKCRPEGLGD